MPNLTISIDEDLIKQARVRVAQQVTSLSAKVRELLLEYVNGTDQVSKHLQAEATSKLMLAIESASQVTKASARTVSGKKRKTLRDEL